MSDSITVNAEIYDWKEKIIYIIKEVEQLDAAKYFLDPVDEIRDDAPRYYDIIQNPVNIKQLKSELMNNITKSPQEFLKKFSLIWMNSFLYNGESHPVSIAAKRIRSKVMYLWRTKLADNKYNKRLVINPGIRKSNRLKKDENYQICENIDHQNVKFENNENEYDLEKNDLSPFLSVTHNISSNVIKMPSLEQSSLEPLDDSKYRIYNKKINELNLHISKLTQELQSVKQEKDDINKKHIRKIRELTNAYLKLHQAFDILKHTINNVNRIIVEQTNVTNNLY